MENKQTQRGAEKRPNLASKFRIAIAALIGTLVVLYTLGVVAGYLPEGQRIDAINLALVAFAALSIILLLRPEILDRLKLLEMSGFKLEMLEEVRKTQARQEDKLEYIALMLALLLPEAEQQHLLNLADRTTGSYNGSHNLRTELRRLRSIALIKMRAVHHVSDMKDDTSFDLAEYIELTDLGQQWVVRIREVQQSQKQV
jgi:hypothetical protein